MERVSYENEESETIIKNKTKVMKKKRNPNPIV
jgi:hypothetical protein